MKPSQTIRQMQGYRKSVAPKQLAPTVSWWTVPPTEFKAAHDVQAPQMLGRMTQRDLDAQWQLDMARLSQLEREQRLGPK